MSPVPYVWYKFDTLSSTKVTNSGSAGASLDATLNNGASVISNNSPTGSTCLNLTNTSGKISKDPTGQYLSIPPFALGEPFSCSCWFKKPDAKELSAKIFEFSISIVDKLLALSFINYTGKLGLQIEKKDKNNKSFSKTYDFSQTNYCDDKWHHIAVVNEKNSLIAYMDNVKVFETTTFVPLENAQRVMNYIGRSSSPITAYSTIQMDDFRLYTTALNSKDIATLFTYKRKGTISSTVSDQKMIGVWIAIAVVVVMIIIYLFRRKKKVE